MRKIVALLVLTSVVLTSCVSTKKYTELEGNYSKKSQELVDTKAELM